MSVSFSHKIIVTGIILNLLEISVWACGPFFPNRVLLGGDDVLLKAPIGSFRQQIELIKPPVPPRFKAVLPSEKDESGSSWNDKFPYILTGKYQHGDRYHRQTTLADLADLEKATTRLALSAKQRDKIMGEYCSARKAIFAYAIDLSRWENEKRWDRKTKRFIPPERPQPRFDPPTIPEGLPVEFAEYLRGSCFYYLGEKAKARNVWLHLLELPKKQRLYRSTWAAFMIAKMLLKEKPDESIPWFQRVRRLAEEGYFDSLGLASSSLGWEARAMLDMKRYEQAIELYLAQMAIDDPSAFVSLQWTAGKALTESPQIDDALAKNDTTRKVITAYIMSRDSSKEIVRKWLVAVEAAEIAVVEEAENLALAAYQAGEMEIAQRWVNVAPPDNNMTRWIRAKLLLRDGKVSQAAEQLKWIARYFPPVRTPWISHLFRRQTFDVQIRGELAVLLLARSNYVEALDVLIQGGHWEDAAYIAECVLTPDELIKYVDLQWPPPQDEPSEKSYMFRRANGPDWFKIRIRYLLARRLTRLERWEEARLYYPSRWQNPFDAYIKAVRDGQNEYLANKERAAALWKAACIARYEGMELMGTEVEPDWFFYGGGFERHPASDTRSRDGSAKLAQSSKDERKRLRDNIVPEKRFHYRYVAADYAWRAAEFMPDNTDETARILCIAGSWLKMRDPDFADRFYKALVNRCRKTELGKEADELRWFPEIEIDKKKLLP
jgi:tetratricopeptide (TPR) repeat protein